MRWFDRAARYAPDDPTPRLSRAAALLAAGDAARAAADFAAVTDQADIREAWLGRAIAAWRAGDPEAAGAALARCLATHRWVGPDAVADAIAASLGRAWCGLRPDETVAWGPKAGAPSGRAPGGGAPPRVVVDGAPWPAATSIPAAAIPAGARLVAVTRDGRPLLGSPLAVAAIRRVEGIVAERDGGLEGWAWHPADPDRAPDLRCGDGTRTLAVAATDLDVDIPRPLMRPRRFRVPAEALAGFTGPVHVTDRLGHPLAGSPTAPGLATRAAAAAARRVAAAFPLRPERDAAAPPDIAPAAPDAPAAPIAPVAATVHGPPAAAPARQGRAAVVVIPVHGGQAETLACLAAVRRTVPPGTDVVVVDDASPEPGLVRALARLAERGAIRLLRLPRNLGFPGAANAGLRAAAAAGDIPADADFVLLNSDTLPTAGWLERLRAEVHAAPDIGTATPFSNDAAIVGYPDPEAPRPAPDGPALARLGRLAARANPGGGVDLPTAVGFCMYMRRECVEQTGVFRDDLFAQGYGEENDFCRRARHLGWRHVAVPGAYVAHAGGRSFGPARAALLVRNAAVLETLHPGYAASIAAWQAADPLAPARHALDAARWRDAARRAPPGPGETVLFVTHDGGGGVERCVRARCQALRRAGGNAFVLRPVPDASAEAVAADRAYRPGLCRTTRWADPNAPDAGWRDQDRRDEDWRKEDWPVLTHALPGDLDRLAALLRLVRPDRVEVHHLLGHHHGVMRLPAMLGVPYDVHVHDYAWLCPRVTLVSTAARYCGEPPVSGCEACVADLGSRLEEDIAVRPLRARSARDLAGARSVVVPSADVARRLAHHFPGARPRVVPHEADPPAAAARAPRPGPDGLRVCVVGAIGVEKGFDVLLGCARDAALRDLPLRFGVVGHTTDDARLIATGRVAITGPYAADEAEALIRAERADIAFIPSVWPETWCFTLGEAWRAGLDVAAFDIGAQAERISATGRGWLLPLGLPPRRVNDALLALSPLATARGVMHTG